MDHAAPPRGSAAAGSVTSSSPAPDPSSAQLAAWQPGHTAPADPVDDVVGYQAAFRPMMRRQGTVTVGQPGRS